MQLPLKAGFQKISDNKQVCLYHLTNDKIQVAITNYGARIVSILVPDKNGALTEVALGFNQLEEYKNSSQAYYGAIVGRYGNRIAKGKFSLNGKEYTLAVNNGPNHLHGGKKGFHDVVWNAAQLNACTVLLTYTSVDGEEGYPGTLHVEIVYSLTDDNEIKISFKGKTDQTTIVNLTNHSYFNLNGAGSGTILNQLLQINADAFVPIDATAIPLGDIAPVQGTPFDFKQLTEIGSRINSDDTQIVNGEGYDHTFVLNKENDKGLNFAARAEGSESGIAMEVFTTEPGVQFYTGNHLDGNNNIRGNGKDIYRSGFCLETQHFPDSPNQPSFPSTVLEPEDTYETETIFKFSVKN